MNRGFNEKGRGAALDIEIGGCETVVP